MNQKTSMAKSSRIVDDIDEEAMLLSIYERDNPGVAPPTRKPESAAEPLPGPPAKATKETPRQKRGDGGDYYTRFLGRNELKARSCVYISGRIHAAISEILRVVADKDITVGGYIDSILTQHLETHKEEIDELYKRGLSEKGNKKPLDFLAP